MHVVHTDDWRWWWCILSVFFFFSLKFTEIMTCNAATHSFLYHLLFLLLSLSKEENITWQRGNKCKLSMHARCVKIVLIFYEKVSGWVTMRYGDSVCRGFTWQLDWDSHLDIISGSSSFREVLNILDFQVCFIRSNCHSIEVILLNV